MNDENDFQFVSDILLSITEKRKSTSPEFQAKISKSRAAYMLQLINDGLAYAETTPLCILDLDQLNNLPNIIQTISDDKALQKVYADENKANNGDLKDAVATVLSAEQFETFSSSLVSNCLSLFDDVKHKINNSAHKKNKIIRSEDLSYFEQEMTDWLSTLSKNEQYQNVSNLRNLNENQYNCLQILIYLSSYIEQQIWLCKKAAAPIFYELARMESLWRVLILCWLYQNRSRLKSFAENEISESLLGFCGIPELALRCFRISQAQPNVICVVAPFFIEGKRFNQYAFYANQGVYVKYCFLAYLQLLANDATDRPEIGEVNASLLRGPSQYPESLDEKVKIIRMAWALLETIVFEKSIANDMANKDLTYIAIWAAFVSRHQAALIGRLKSKKKYLINIHTAPADNPQGGPSGLQIAACLIGKKVSLEIAATSKNKSAEMTDETLTIVPPDKNSKKLTDNYHLQDKFRRYLDQWRVYHQAFHSWGISLLSDWLQRHFSNNETQDYDQFALLGSIGQYVCRLLTELTRADIGATIYQVDYGKPSAPLKIVGDDPASPDIMVLRDERQQLMDGIRIDSKINEMDHSYSYLSLEENSFYYFSDAETDREVFKPYPVNRRPKSLLVMPLHMEQRMLGVIEIKGSQKNHFRWSQSILLQQVASVLAPYFYRQQLLQSLSDVSRWMISSSYSNFAEERQQNSLASVCEELCQIFLCRNAEIWLRDETNNYRFILKGASDSEVYNIIDHEWDKNIAFSFESGSDKSISDLIFFHALDRKIITDGIRQESGRLTIQDPNLFLTAHIIDEEGETDCKLKQGNVTLYHDWLETGVVQLRQYLLKQGTKEIMIFALTTRKNAINRESAINDFSMNEVIGFVNLHHDRFSNYSQHWRHTLRLVNDQIVIALEQTGLLEDEDQMIRRVLMHEAKEEGLYFAGRIDNYTNRASYFRHGLEDILHSGGVSGKAETSIRELLNMPGLMRDSLNECRDAYQSLNAKLDKLSQATFYAYLSLSPDILDSREDIYMKSFIHECLNGYRARFRSRGIYCTVNIDSATKDLIWQVPKELITRVLQNLLDNAAKYAIQNTIVEITATYVTLTVSNISHHDPSLKGDWPFSSDKRGKTAIKMRVKGEGYGLTSVKLICIKILEWNCWFEQTKTPVNEDWSKFSISIGRKL